MIEAQSVCKHLILCRGKTQEVSVQDTMNLYNTAIVYRCKQSLPVSALFNADQCNNTALVSGRAVTKER